MDMEIKRDFYLQELLQSRHNGMIKVITGLRRSGKSYLLFNLFADALIKEGIAVFEKELSDTFDFCIYSFSDKAKSYFDFNTWITRFRKHCNHFYYNLS